MLYCLMLLIGLLFIPMILLIIALGTDSYDRGPSKGTGVFRPPPTHYLDETIGQYRRIDNNKIEAPGS